jgi:hypothetical protein
MDAEPRSVSQVALSGRESVEAALRADDSGGSFRVFSATPGLAFPRTVAHAGAPARASRRRTARSA